LAKGYENRTAKAAIVGGQAFIDYAIVQLFPGWHLIQPGRDSWQNRLKFLASWRLSIDHKK